MLLLAGACGSSASPDTAANAPTEPAVATAPAPEATALAPLPLAAGPPVEADVRSVALAQSACSGQFIAHDLDHTTQPLGAVEAIVDGTGAGVLAEDLDGDGYPDLVLPNLSGTTSVFWNNGDLTFRPQALETNSRFRQAVAADLDSDGDRDLVFTTSLGPAQPFWAEDDGSFDRREIRDFRIITYSISAGDLEGDGDVDFVTSSYNAELTAARDPRAISGTNVGTAVYRPNGTGGYDEEVLTGSAQALVSHIVDIDGDGQSDVVVGNDLGTPDRIWLGGPRGLTLTQLFDTTTLSTMSIDIGDIDNDGDRDLVATDMKPLADEPASMWEPALDDIAAAQVDDVQIPQNVLQVAEPGGRYTESATQLGVDATGWSWSALLGDLDNDGFQDLHVVNGMVGSGMFDQLPNTELVEPNQAFRNSDGQFVPAPEWGLGDTAGGRGMAMADLDLDGDLDIIINNMGTPSRIWENQLCGGGAIIIEPLWSGTQNLDALGATVIVETPGQRHLRLISSSRGYISTSPTRAHVGLGDSTAPVSATIVWPDGATTQLDDLMPGSLVTVERSNGPVADEGAGS